MKQGFRKYKAKGSTSERFQISDIAQAKRRDLLWKAENEGTVRMRYWE